MDLAAQNTHLERRAGAAEESAANLAVKLDELEDRLSATRRQLTEARKQRAEKEAGFVHIDRQDAQAAKAPSTEVTRLNNQLRKARSRAATAQMMARAAREALAARQAEADHQANELEVEAAEARENVDMLAAQVEVFASALHAAEQGWAQAYARLNHGIAKAKAAKPSQASLAEIDDLATAVHNEHVRYLKAATLKVQAEHVAFAAEPRASELEASAAVLRAEAVNAAELFDSWLAAAKDYEADSWNDEYGRWVELHDTIHDKDRRAIRARLFRLPYQPLISIVVPVYNPRPSHLIEAVKSVQAQLYRNWELCIADDASPNPVIAELLSEMASKDPRIKWLKRDSNGHISAASNSALSLASGEFIALMDHDDILPEHALFEIVACLNQHPELDLIYSDEDHIDDYGERSNPHFKTDYNHELMLGQNIINHLGVYRRSLVEKLGGFRLGYEGSQDYDLALRVIDATKSDRIRHIPEILYHWRSGSEDASFSEAFLQKCIASARQAIADHLQRNNQVGQVVDHPIVPVWHRVKRSLPKAVPLVSIIIPTKDKPDILRPCVEGILNRTTYPNIELIIVDHQSTNVEAIRFMETVARDSRVKIIPYEGVFNYSAINNMAASKAQGEILAFLNNDIDIINADWLVEMVTLALLPEVGAVGAKLLYPDDRVQHGGVILGTGGVAGHFFHLLGRDMPGYFGRAVLTSAVSAVTAACLVVRKAIFEDVGGFDAVNLTVAFNDVDLCLKIGQRHYRNVWAAHAQLYHYESVSRGSDATSDKIERFQREIEFMQQKWGEKLEEDPYYNPNFNMAAGDFSLAFPPRKRRSWFAG